jgi:tetratricopeptide (TPR) repeat protein
MLDLKCDNCGNRTLKKQGSALVCSFCGSRYEIDESNNVTNKVLTDAKLMSCYLEAEKNREAGKFVEEFQELTKALEIDPNNASTLVKMGRCCREMGQIDRALECYNQAITIDPTFGVAYTNMGTIYVLQEKYAEAADIYEKGLPQIDKSQSDYWTAYANYALVIGKLGNLTRAASMIDEAEQHGYQNADGARKLLGLSVKRSLGSDRSASFNAGGWL